jgi:hypothetical protein
VLDGNQKKFGPLERGGEGGYHIFWKAFNEVKEKY